MAGLEFDELTARMALLIGIAAAASLGAAGLYAHESAAPTCDSEPAQGRVYRVLRDQFHLDSIFVNNVRTISGGFFSGSHECSADVTTIRGNVNASDMPWQEIRYRIVLQDQSQPFALTVNLGSHVPLADPPPSFWTRLLAHL